MKTRAMNEILKGKDAREFLESELFYKKGESKGKSITELWFEYRRANKKDRDNKTSEY